MKKETRFIIQASGDFLVEGFPNNLESMNMDEIENFINCNSLDNNPLSAYEIYEQIRESAFSWMSFFNLYCEEENV